MASKPKSKYSENLVKLQCSICKNINYYTRKNKKTTDRKLEFNKWCKHCRKTTLHKEVKKR